MTSESCTGAWGCRRSALTGRGDDGSTGPEGSDRRWQSASGASRTWPCLPTCRRLAPLKLWSSRSPPLPPSLLGFCFRLPLRLGPQQLAMRSTHQYSPPPPSSRPGTHHWSPTLSKTFSPERVIKTLCVYVLCRRRMLEVANGWELIHRPSAGPCSPTKRSGLLRASGSVLRLYLVTFASIAAPPSPLPEPTGSPALKSHGRFPRHENMKEIVGRALRSAGLPTRLEPLGLCRGTNNKIPDGETLVPWQSGQLLAFDVTCIDSFAPSRQHCQPGEALVTKEAEKRAKYADLRGHLFSPVAVETLGRWGTQSFAFLKELGRRLNSVSGDSRSSLFLCHRLSVAVTRGNCLAVLGSIPGGPVLL